ncbi:SRPBCC family protein [Cochleicola gelatinilyticus]|uniref:Polyketide cyclase n=1 Tax=Cochleicola gelatinilyticus TaxID=1763537 RepID=A0A167J984_9FLAO|nr:SRPBCC family protein [Cochleicola gelatinilyticus]OAB80449.1 polyketide cyclase [Cochleicola gelatinilyticus]
MNKEKTITVTTKVQSDLKQVWEVWTGPEHIKQWNSPSPDWHTPKAKNDLREKGRFSYRMEAKDGSMGFDFSGTYTKIVPYKHIAYTLDDDRKVSIDFKEMGDTVAITETFEPENENPIDMQRSGWQAILNAFKQYAEKH